MSNAKLAYSRIVALGINAVQGEPLSRHTTFRIGGPAAVMVECDSVDHLATVLQIAQDFECDWTVLGKGSNLLVSDKGYDGIAIVLGRDFKTFHRKSDIAYATQLENWDPDTTMPQFVLPKTDIMVCGAGVQLGRLVSEAFSMGYSGFEFAVGIPGSFGGAVFMNAGTQDGTIGSVVKSVVVYIPGQGLHRYLGEDLPWAYRYSGIPKGQIVLEAEIFMHKETKATIQAKMEGSLTRRRKTQPSGVPNAGSIFRNPVGDSAGRLIEEAGFKGYRVGGAQVSDKHANFIVNVDNATANDVLIIINQIRSKVEQLYGIQLQPETKFLGF